jgi:hypothetical protein
MALSGRLPQRPIPDGTRPSTLKERFCGPQLNTQFVCSLSCRGWWLTAQIALHLVHAQSTGRITAVRLNRCVAKRRRSRIHVPDCGRSTQLVAGIELRRLTFEVSWRQRQDARPKPQKMYTVPVAWAWWPAVGAQLDRGVRPHGGCALDLPRELSRPPRRTA